MMPERPSGLTAYYPLFLALMLVAGLFIGRSLSTGEGITHGLFIGRGGDPSEKVGQVLDYIDREYVDEVEKNALVDEMIDDLLQRLDPHSYYITAEEFRAFQEPLEGSFDGIGVEFTIQRDTVMVITPVIGGPSEQLGIQAGDRFISADGKPLSGVGISNNEVMELLRGPSGSNVQVQIKRQGNKDLFTVNIERRQIPINSISAALITSGNTGYIKLIRFAKNTHEEFLAAVKDLKGQGMTRLVLDLRGNGGGYLHSAVKLADEFLKDGKLIVYTEGRAHPRRSEFATSAGSLEEMPLAVLLDEGSASASEVLAGALQDNDRAVIVGRRSFGKGLVQEQVELPDQSALRLTTARYYTPSGRCIQKPYGDGIDYSSDLIERGELGELISADSVVQDTADIHRTIGGRKVYGGGGIMPDVFVPIDTTGGSHYLSELFYTGTLNQFAFNKADSERKDLEAYGDVLKFDREFQVTDKLLQELQRYAKERGIEERPGEMDRSRKQIALRLKANIARNIWGSNGYYPILLDDDLMFKRASQELQGT